MRSVSGLVPALRPVGTFFTRLSSMSRFTALIFVLACGVAAGSPSVFAGGTATTTTLAITSGGNAATSVTSGTVITLTATVTAGSTPVTTGLVKFCDATATYCEDIHIVGTAQLTSAGTAVFKFRPWIGSHSYKAVFVGTDVNAGSSSSAVSLTVPGPYPTTTTVSVFSTSTPGTYAPNASVTSVAPPSAAQALTGTISFLDTSNNNAVLGTATLVDQAYGLESLLNPSPLATGAYPSGIAIADFNRDGIPDIAITNNLSNSVTVELGNGDGTFTAAASLTTGVHPMAIAVADFNGDGIPDLAVANFNDGSGSTGSVTVFLGVGNSTFTTVSNSPAAGSGQAAIAVGDFNGDGIPDLAVANEDSSTITVLLGNGDGTFTAASSSPTTGGEPDAIAVADFNGDGIQDIAEANQAGTINVYLGNGDGTFNAVPNSFSAGNFLSYLVVADFNGDGIPDVAATGGTSVVLLGNGDGTFTAVPNSNALSGALAVTVGDFNGDGIPDLAGTYDLDDEVVTYLGNGDGTFSAGSTFSASIPTIALQEIAAGDLNGDGFSDLIATGPYKSTTSQPAQAAITLIAPESFAAASTAITVSPGPHTIEASYPGSGNNAPSISGTAAIDYAVPTTMSLSAVPGTNLQAGQSVTLTATITPYSSGGYSTNGGTVSFNNNGVLLGTGILSGGVATLTVPSLNAGTAQLDAVYSGNNYFGGSASGISLAVAATHPSLTLSANPLNSMQGQAVTLTATLTGYYAIAGEVITFSDKGQTIGTGTLSSSGVATLTTSTLPVGINSLIASYPGDSNNNPATGTLQASVTGSSQTMTSTALSITSSGTPVTTAAEGTPVVLTASVAAGSTPVTHGTATFCDQINGQLCDSLGGLGTAQLTASGTASITIRPGIGAHSFAAAFAGTASDAASASTVSGLTVTGQYATTTDFSSTAGSFSTDVSFTGSVAGIAPYSSSLSPSGTVQFVDQSASNTLLATSPSLSSSKYLAAWFTPASSALAIGAEPFGIAVGDFNHDGVPDFAVTSSAANTVGILLGKGGGTFKPQVTYAVGSGAYAVAVGDFNGDGNLDLTVTNFSADTVSILLGNGDGTFQAQQTFATGNGPDAIVVGDFNGDGNLDLAVTNQTDNTISILSGNGNGTFQGQQTYATGSSPVAIAVGNFNGDGYLDLAVVNNASATVSILLGNGDGTFQTQVPYATGNGPISIAVSDFNSDGNLDLAVANSTDNTLSVLMGNGDGTFQTQVAYSTGGTSPEAVAAANLSGLGYIDLAVTNLQSSSSGNPAVIILQNNGSGTFTQASHQYVTGAGPLAVAAGDWNGDGMADLAVLNNTAATVTVLTNGSGPVSTTGATASIDLPGEHTVAATYSGDTNFSTSTSLRTVSAATVPATLTFTANPNPSNYGSPVTLTATLSPYSAADVSSNGESIQFLNGTTLLGTGTLSSGVATLVTTSLPVGVNSIQAKYAGDIALTSTSGMVSQIVRPATLTVTAANTSRAFGAPNPSLTGTVSGALNGDTFTVTGSTTATTTSPAGSYPIVPTASGTNIADYTVVTVNGTLTVTKATPAITWAAPASITYGTALGSAQLNAASTIAGTFTYSPALGTVLSVGSHTLTATFTPQDTTDYTTATATVTLTVGKTTPTIALAASSTDAFAGSPITFAATLTSPAAIPAGTVSFYDGMALLSTATLNSGAATYMTSSLAAGTHSITAVYSGNTNFSAVTSTAVTETIETLAVTVASGGSSSVTASPGGQAVYTFTLAPPSGATFPAAIDLSVGGLPSGATATFSPASIAAGTGSTNIKLTVSLPASAALQRNPWEKAAVPVSLGLILLPLFTPRRKGLRHWRGSAFMLVLGTISLAALNGCAGGGGGGGNQNPSPQTYTLTITATSGSLSSSTNVTLIVE